MLYFFHCDYILDVPNLKQIEILDQFVINITKYCYNTLDNSSIFMMAPSYQSLDVIE